jgi:hypothetical protein
MNFIQNAGSRIWQWYWVKTVGTCLRIQLSVMHADMEVMSTKVPTAHLLQQMHENKKNNVDKYFSVG